MKGLSNKYLLMEVLTANKDEIELHSITIGYHLEIINAIDLDKWITSSIHYYLI